MCLGNISKGFTANNVTWKKKNAKNRIKYVYKFFVVYNIIDTSNVIDIHKYLMKNHDIKQCLELSKKMFIVLLATLANASNHAKWVSLSNHKCEI